METSGSELAAAALDEPQRRTLRRLVDLLETGLGDDLVAAWLYGSRARGEQPHDESDVDLMIVTRGGAQDDRQVDDLVFEAARAEGTNPASFSIQVVTADWIGARRRIKSFFLEELDRDKIVLAGEP